MSDLSRGDTLIASGGNGRPPNGGSRTAQGPAPPFSDPARAVRTPTQVMQERRAREARKRVQQEAEQRRREEEESRMQQQEREAVGVVGGQSGQWRPGNRVASGNQPQYAQNPGPPPSTYQQATIGGGGRQETIPATNQPSRRSQIRSGEPGPVGSGQQGAYVSGNVPAGTNPRRNPAENIANPGANPKVEPIAETTQQPQAAPQQAGRASFPHAFERWETLSSHWEGLTSYWIRRIQENSNELDSKPIQQQMSRQITDLSAAGANLFHAVVELQRLRASSERKFQRWFFETRDEQERAREREAELERQLRNEQEERAKINTSSSAVAEGAQARAEELTREHIRELRISKEEARRAWEELGRREQEERERTIALRNGEPTVIGGVQVVPMQGIPSRQTSEAIRPTTRDGPYPGGPGPATMGGMPPPQQGPSRSQTTTTTLDSPGDEQRQFSFRPEADSPTNTDPFTDTRRAGDPGAQYQSTTQRPTQLAASSAENAMRAATSGPSPARGYGQTSSAGTGGGTFYQQGMADTILRNPITTTAPAQTPLYPPARSGTADTNPSEQRSYIPSTVSGNGSSQGGEEEYEINPDGSYTRDAQGRRIPYGGGRPSRLQQQAASDDGTDEYDVASDIERERQHSQRYGGGGTASSNLPRTTSGNIPQQQLTAQQQRQLYSPVTVPPPTESLAAAASQFTQGSQAGPISPISPADYSGTGYGAPGGSGNTSVGAGASEWETPTASPRHNYPTRLSDITEEQSGPTSPSRASHASVTGAPEMPMPPVSSAYSRGR